MDYKARQIEEISKVLDMINPMGYYSPGDVSKKILEVLEDLDIQIQEEYHAEMNMVYNQDSDAKEQA